MVEAARRTVTKAEIVSAAARVFRREGYRSSSMNQIAAEVGLQKASLYHHIESKESLLVAVADAALGRSIPAAERIIGSDRTACEKLRDAVVSHVLVTGEVTGEIAAFMLYAQEIEDPTLHRFYIGRRRYYGELMRNFVESAMHEHKRTDHPEVVTLAVLGMCNWMTNWYRKDGELSVDVIADRFADMALQMVGCTCGGQGV